MIKWDDLLSEETSKELDAKIARSVQTELLALNMERRAQRRRTWLAWFVPATMGALGAVAFWKMRPLTSELPQQTDGELGDMAFSSDVSLTFEDVDIDEETFAILEDFDLLENLEVLEQWNS